MNPSEKLHREYAERHEAEHGNREAANTRYVEVCWKCAEDWLQYASEHPYEIPDGNYVVATRPGECG